MNVQRQSTHSHLWILLLPAFSAAISFTCPIAYLRISMIAFVYLSTCRFVRYSQLNYLLNLCVSCSGSMSLSKSVTGKGNSKLRSVAREFCDEGIMLDGTGDKLICQYCSTVVQSKRSQMTQHIATKKHDNAKKLKMKQQLLDQCTTENKFMRDLCQVGLTHIFKYC